MADASFPATTPVVYTPVAGQSLANAGHIDDLHEKDRKEIIALGTKMGTGSSTPVRGTAMVASGTGSSAWDTLARRNILINGDFRVWQRTTMPTTNNLYGPDRWRLLIGGASAATVAKESTSGNLPATAQFGVRLTPVSGTAKFGIFQPIEASEVFCLRGLPVSLQATINLSNAAISDVRAAVVAFAGTADTGVNGDPLSAWNSAGTNPTLAANYSYLNTPVNLSCPIGAPTQFFFENLTVPTNANNLGVLIWCDDTSNGGTFSISNVQLEQGAACSELERRHYGLELYLCQRFFEKIPGAGSSYQAYLGMAANTAGAGSGDVRALIPYAVPKRITGGTAIVGSNTDLAVLNSGFSAAGTGTIALTQIGDRVISAQVSSVGTISVTQGQCHFIRWSSPSAYIEISAEL